MRAWFVMVTLGLVAVATLAGACSSGGEEEEPGPPPPVIELTIRDLPPPTANWEEPSAVAVGSDGIETTIWVLDSGRDRILRLDSAGAVTGVLCETDECALALRSPLSMILHDGDLYVANTGANEIVVITPDGQVGKTIDLSSVDGAAAEPAGLVEGGAGDFYVSDSANARILHFDAQWNLIETFETSDSEDPKYRLLQPLGLTLDSDGNLYVADAGDGQVKKYSPQWRFLEGFVTFDNPTFSEPQDVAVGPDGTVYMSDIKRTIVQVFNARGDYLGIVGLFDASRVDSTGVLSRPYGLTMVGNNLYVVDRIGALFNFLIDPAYWAERSPIGPMNAPSS